ncbi:hypothetical protein L1049_004935 [Liquidambar formosana]|uniref:TF-B3 domain-containing protein n=1 Tax=Liquidambar formosana TaxID=63359 RepID=A0AAP0WW64_LIQFO
MAAYTQGNGQHLPQTLDELEARVIIGRKDGELDYDDDGVTGSNGFETVEKPVSIAKTLTQSDANNGGGFSVPRYCAETIFPRLDYSADPLVQTVIAKDVHGEVWKFRHIYRTPVSAFVDNWVEFFCETEEAGCRGFDCVLKAENGDLCVGIRRAKRGIGGGCGFDSLSGWNPTAGNCISPFGGFSITPTFQPSPWH